MSAKRIAVNTIMQVIGKFVGGSATLLISLILARRLGPGGYGEYTIVATYAALFYGFVDFGLNAAYIQRSHLTASRSWTHLLYVRILLSFILMLAALAILAFLPSSGAGGYTPYVKFGIILFVPSILVQALITTANAIFQKNLTYVYAMWAIVAGSVSSLGAIYVSSLLLRPSVLVYAALVATLLGGAVTAAVSIHFANRHGSPTPPSWNEMRSLIVHALPLGVTLVLNLLYFRADNIILTVTRPASDVGIYGLAYKLFEFPLVVPTFFMNALYPFLVSAYESGDLKRLRSYVTRSMGMLLVAGIAVSTLLWVSSPLIAQVKSEFSRSIVPFRILVAGLPVFFMTGLTMWLLVTTKRRRSLMAIYCVGMIGNVVSNALLIPIYGYVAAAWITVLSETGILVLSLIALRHELLPGFHRGNSLPRPS